MTRIADLTLYRNDLSLIPARSGVYVISALDDVVLYVGKSTNFINRINSHLAHKAFFTNQYNHSFYKFSFIYHNEHSSLYSFEQEIITELSPLLNGGKGRERAVMYLNKDAEMYVCKGKNNQGDRCRSTSKYNGYCSIHNPLRPESWFVQGKPVTTQINKLIHELDNSRGGHFIYLNTETFNRLRKENKLAYDLKAFKFKFGRHYLVIEDVSDIEIRRYERFAV